MNILISNDDGIRAEGIARLAAAALPFGRVYVAAPQSQCSGMSQKLTIRGTLAVEQADFPSRWRPHGQSAAPGRLRQGSCQGPRPLQAGRVLTGVNQGWNAGLDIAYSGTIGAALEGVMNGIPAIAFSAREFCDPGAMEVYLPRVLQELLQALPKPGTLWNVNFPDCAASACKGILRGRVPAACSFYDNEYDRAEGALSIRVSNPGPEQCREGSDIHAILHGYVSIGEVRSPLF
ncbi:MAG: 5'/3'-nucleotidase SurE [Oscillospiraceae bacterium]